MGSQTPPSSPNSSKKDSVKAGNVICCCSGNSDSDSGSEEPLLPIIRQESSTKPKPVVVNNPLPQRIPSPQSQSSSPSSSVVNTPVSVIQDPPEDKTHFIEIILLDDEGSPVPDIKYEVTDPENKKHSGTLSSRGRAKVENIKAGQCKVTFPELDEKVWEYTGVE